MLGSYQIFASVTCMKLVITNHCNVHSKGLFDILMSFTVFTYSNFDFSFGKCRSQPKEVEHISSLLYHLHFTEVNRMLVLMCV